MKNYHKNPRTIKDKQFANLRAWLLELGDLSGIVHDLNTDEVISGNQRMRAIDIAKCEIVLTEGPHDPDAQGTVAHGYVLWQGAKYNYRQVRWTAEQCEKANIVANKAGGSWDFDILANEFEKDDLLEWGFELEELGMLPDDETPEDPGAQIDKAEELREKWGVESGQLWQLGEHRLICGDCTDAAVVARVMDGERAQLCLTDPPYATGGKSGDYDISPDELSRLIENFLPLAKQVSERVLLTPGNAYQFMYPKPTWVLAWFVQAGVGANPWGFTFWNAIFAYGNDPYLARGLGSRPDAFVKTEPAEKVDHPTSKPVEVWSWILERGSVERNDLIFDPFLGSGTTMVAAQRLGRRCFGIEISPGYAAVTLQRMSDMGLTPELVVVNSAETVQNAT